MRIQELLDDLKDEVTDVQRRIEIIDVLTSFGNLQSAGGNAFMQDSKQMLFQEYRKDFEEIHKVLAANTTTVASWFGGYSRQAGSAKQSLNPFEFQAALTALSLSRVLSQSDFQNFSSLLNASPQGTIELREIESAIRRAISGSTDLQLQEDILEKIARAFLGDDQYLNSVLLRADTEGRGRIKASDFVNIIKSNSP